MCTPLLNGRCPLGPAGYIYRTKVPQMDSRFRGNDGVRGLLPVARGLVPRSSALRRCSGACPTPACAPPLHGGLSPARLCSAVARGLVTRSSLLRRSVGAGPPLVSASPQRGGLSRARLCSAVARGLVPRPSVLRRCAGACRPLPAPDQTLYRIRTPALRYCQAAGHIRASQTSNTQASAPRRRVPWASAFRFRYRCGT